MQVIFTILGYIKIDNIIKSDYIIRSFLNQEDNYILPIYSATSENIKKAADIIKSGGLVAFPTETVYGLGADAFNHLAIARIFEVKKRPFFDPLIVHIADHSDLEKIATGYGHIEKKLIDKFWPGPLTLIMNKTGNVPDIVTSGLQTVGIRMPANKAAAVLIKESGCPIAAPSANLFGQISPVKAEHVQKQLGAEIKMIIDGGECQIGIESTIIKVENDIPVVLRYGGIAIEDIKKITGKLIIPDKNRVSENKNIESPGQLPFHYSPLTPLILIDNVDDQNIISKNAGLLSFKLSEMHKKFRHVEVLSRTGDIIEAAANLFSCLHSLDSAGLDVIYAERVPLKGLGIAIMDRLTKAANRY
jgi:L-threonylcarbamoyladenylate synthase